MIITIIADVLGEENNGTTITVTQLIGELKNRGHTVRVVSTRKVENDDDYYTLPKRSFGIFTKYIEKNGAIMAKPVEKVIYDAVVDADVVHIVLPFKVGKFTMKLLEKLNKPYTTAFHCQPENITAHVGCRNVKWINKLLYKRFHHQFYKHAKFIHCPSVFIAKELEKLGYKANLKAISNGVLPIFKEQSTEKPDELKDKYCILYMGRFSKEKRHEVLIDAVAKSKYKDKIQLIFTGIGPLKDKLQKRGNALPNPLKIWFLSQDVQIKTLNYCDLYVHASDVELESIACTEAICCGLVPIISDSKTSATNTFALTEHNLFKSGNSDDLARKIDFMIENPEIKEELKERYRDYSKQFQLSYCIDKMEEMFQDAIKANNEQEKEDK